MRRLAILALFFALVAPSPARAQVGYDTPNGRVEVFGLSRWTLPQLRDSLKAKRPGLELEDAACQAVLRDDLHFADAEVREVVYQARAENPLQRFFIIKVVEPQDRARIHWRTIRRDSTRILRPEYASVVVGASDTTGALWPVRILLPLQLYHRDSVQRDLVLARAPKAAREDARRLWTFLEVHRGETDWRRAMRVLRTDPSYANRVVAASVLSNFAERDSSWYALVEALRDPDETVRTTAAEVLRTLPRRQVDWAPATESLRYLLGGTNVGVTDDLFVMLNTSRVSPTLARALLRDNMEWIAMHLRSAFPSASGGARAMLTQLNAGKDLGPDSAAWIEWTRSL